MPDDQASNASGEKQEEKADGIPTGQGSNENEDGSTKKDAIKKKSKIQICEDDSVGGF